METHEKQDSGILIRIADKLIEAQRELDELVVQLALGKAEAKDKFEEIKREFNARLAEFRKLALEERFAEAGSELKTRFEELQLQLALGKAESKEIFEEQREKIEHTLEQLRQQVEKWIPEGMDREFFEHEIEKFKLKLEILRLRFVVKKFEVKDSFRDGMKTVKKKIEQTSDKIKSKFHGESNFDHLKKEARGFYKDLKKALHDL